MNSRPHVLPSSRGSHPTTSLKDHTYHIVEKAVLCIAAFWPTRLPQRVQNPKLPHCNSNGGFHLKEWT
jgi:hypothetical protein